MKFNSTAAGALPKRALGCFALFTSRRERNRIYEGEVSYIEAGWNSARGIEFSVFLPSGDFQDGVVCKVKLVLHQGSRFFDLTRAALRNV